MNVGSLCKRAIVAIDGGATLREAAKLMLVRHVGALLVTVEGDGRRDALGLVTDRDLVIACVVTHSDVLIGITKDDIYDYQNRVTLASLTSIRVYFSDVVTKLDFTVPAADDRIATSPLFVDLPGNYTAMIQRFNQANSLSVLWISTVDIWLKVTALLEQDSFGNWVQLQQVAESERIGAYPFAVAEFKGDAIFLAQDNTLQRIQTVDVLAKDSLFLISDEVEDLLKRLDKSEVRLYYFSRYIFICFPASSTTIMLDMVENHFQPPQTLPMGYMSVIGGWHGSFALGWHPPCRDRVMMDGDPEAAGVVLGTIEEFAEEFATGKLPECAGQRCGRNCQRHWRVAEEVRVRWASQCRSGNDRFGMLLCMSKHPDDIKKAAQVNPDG